MVKVTKDYTFTAADGSTVALKDLFGGKKQLLVYHFMFEPSADVGCHGCAFLGEHIPDLRHIRTKETALVCVSRAPVEKLEAFKAKNGWTFPWYSSGEGDFNYDFHATLDESRAPTFYNFKSNEELQAQGKRPRGAGDMPGMSVFLLQDGEVYHTYSTYERGLDFVLTTLHLLDLTPLGRQDGEYGPGSYKFKYEYEQDA